jgi:predicted esterase
MHGYGQLARYFIRHFEKLVQPGVLVVAPEALSRFYLENNTGRVGASWMTKESRLDEIADYLNYLSKVYAWIKSSIGHESFRLHVLGFSQGAATACRWVAEKHPPAHSLTCWAGFFPPDLNWSAGWQRKGLETHVVVGTEDKFVTDEALAKFEEVVRLLDIQPKKWEFRGGHEIHGDTLLALANHLRNK